MLTPPRIDDPNLFKLNKIVAPGTKPVNVSVKPGEKAAINECFENVADRLAQHGGRRVLGWQVWAQPYMIEAEFHAVWESPEWQWTDITPKASQVSEIVFIPDENAAYNGNQVDNIRLNTTTNQLVDEYIALAQARFSVLNYGEKANQKNLILTANEQKLLAYISSMMVEIERMLAQQRGRNSSCFCSSTLKYKHCHGKDLVPYLNQIKAGQY